MTSLGFLNQSVTQLQSFVFNRSFQINIKKFFSSARIVGCHKDLSQDLYCLYVNDMKHPVDYDLVPYEDDSCLVYQQKDASKIDQSLNKNIQNTCDQFVNSKLSINFGEDKTKSILFGLKQKLSKAVSVNIRYGAIQIKIYTVTYFQFSLDENLSGKSMALKVINKVILSSQPLRRLLCNALQQPSFDYAI